MLGEEHHGERRGALAAGLLDECGCEVLIHVNSDVPESVPAHGRISGFMDACRERGVACELMLRDFGHGYEEADRTMHQVFEELEERFPGRRKGCSCRTTPTRTCS